MNTIVVNRKSEKDHNWNFSSNFLFKYFSYWPLFLFLILLAVIGSWIYSNSTKPVYRIDAKILVNDGNKISSDVLFPELKTSILSKKTTVNEVSTVQFRTLLNQVVKKLNLFAPVFYKEKIKSISAYTNSPITIIADRNHIKETDKIFFTVDANNVYLNKKNYPFNVWVNTSYGKLEFKRKKFQPDQADKRFYFSLIPTEKVISSIVSKMKVIHDSKTPGIFTISFTDEVPLRGQDIVIETVKGFNEVIADKQNKQVKEASRLVDEQIAQVENDLLSIENKILYTKLLKVAINTDRKKSKLLETINTNNQKVDEINIKLTSLNKTETDLQAGNLSELFISKNGGSIDPSLAQFLVKIKHLQTEAKKIVDKNSIPYVLNNEKIDKTQIQILENIQNQRVILQKTRNDLLQKNNFLLSALMSKFEKPNQIVDIKSEQAQKRAYYVSLLKQKEELAISSISGTNNSKITSYLEAYPINHNGNLIYLGAVFTALITGFGVVAKKELTSSRVILEKDIETITQIPIIGKISVEKLNSNLIIGSNKKDLITSEFRKLRAMLNYLTLDSKHKRVLITSGIAGEGKSFVALNLAVSQALAGKKVVLLTIKDDCNNLIISNFNSGNATFETLIHPTEINKNLFSISIEENTGNVSKSIKSGNTAELLKYLDERFDCIIIDHATNSSVSDTYNLSALCDATLYVIRQGYTPKETVTSLDEEKLNNTAIVFNGITNSTFINNFSLN